MKKYIIPLLMGYILAFNILNIIGVERRRHVSEIQKCMLLMHTPDPHSDHDSREDEAKEERKEAVCNPKFNRTIDCTINNSLSSDHPLDVLMRNSTSMARWKEANRFLCSRYQRMHVDSKICARNSMVCMKTFDWHIYPWCVPDTRCYYRKIHTCSEPVAVVWGKYVFLAKSNVCIVSDQFFQLYPLYGPELMCYRPMDIDIYESLDWVYRRFCRLYNHTWTINCIRDEIRKHSSEDLDENKMVYLQKAEKFAKERHILCERLNQVPNIICKHQQENITYTCLKDLYYEGKRKELSLAYSIEIYATCLYVEYRKCNINVARIIRDNIMSYLIDTSNGNARFSPSYPNTYFLFTYAVTLLYAYV